MDETTRKCDGTLTRPSVQSAFLYHRSECLAYPCQIDSCVIQKSYGTEEREDLGKLLALLAGIPSTHSVVTLELALHAIPAHFLQGSLDFPQPAGTFFHFFIKDVRAAAARGRRQQLVKTSFVCLLSSLIFTLQKCKHLLLIFRQANELKTTPVWYARAQLSP
jgi:hypothetical protein